jgi:HEAT repeat protein
MREEVGLAESAIVLLTNGNLVGGLIAGYLWGWASDRYGSKPVMMSGLAIRLLLPVFWFLMPRQSEWSLYAALGIAGLQGIADVGWSIGAARLLFVSVTPSAQSMEYLALYYAWAGLVTGVSQALGGSILDLADSIRGQIGPLTIDPYIVLQAGALVLTLIAVLLLSHVRADSRVSLGQFAGLFFQGNPFRAIEAIVRYQRARDERAAVFNTARLGQAYSHLAVDELLDALRDPRFNVRFEAIISIARMPPNPRLTDALIEVMRGKSPALSVIAAWALGRTGDLRAIPPLREGLKSPYRSIQSHAARSLATLGDQGVIPQLLKRVDNEPDYGLKIAYASALGKLGVVRALNVLLRLLHSADDESTRMEMALALARIIGDEDYFIRLLRQVHSEPGTALAQALVSLKRKIARLSAGDANIMIEYETTTDALAREDLSGGALHLHQLLGSLPTEQFPPIAAAVLQDSAKQIKEQKMARMEYVLLAIHALRAA